MCFNGQDKKSFGLLVVKFYSFTNLFILIFSIIHYVVGSNPANYISDRKGYFANYEGDLGLIFFNIASNFMIIFFFNLMNSILLWNQYLNGGIKERVIFEGLCAFLSYLTLVLLSVYLAVDRGNFVSSVIPVLILTIIIFLMSIYFLIIIWNTAEKFEKKLINNLAKEAIKHPTQNNQLNLNRSNNNQEEVKNNNVIELKKRQNNDVKVINNQIQMNE